MHKTSNIVDELSIILILLSSGTAYFYMLHASYTILFFLFGSLYIAYKNRINYKAINSYTITYLLLIILNLLVFKGEHRSTIIYSHFIFLFGTLLITTSTPFHVFRKYFINITSILALFSIIIYTLYILGFITPQLIEANNGLSYHIFIFHNFGSGESGFGLTNRLCGLYWEPGIYQMILNISILLNLDYLHKIGYNKITIRLLIIILAIILTGSTTGYIVLILIFIFYYKKNNIKKIGFCGFLGLILIYFIWKSGNIQDKFSEDNHSYLVRYANNYAMFKMFTLKPLLGYGVDTKLFSDISYQLGNVSSSNGILLGICQYGILWFIALMCGLYKGVKKMNIPMNIHEIIIIICILFMNEPLVYCPLCLIFMLPFKNYKLYE